MKQISFTDLRKALAETMQEARRGTVLLTKRGAADVILMPAHEARISLLCAYALGKASEAQVIQRLGLSTSEALAHELKAAEIQIRDPA